MSSARKLIALVLVALAVTIVATCSPGYVIRAGIEEAKILGRRRPIPEVIADPATGSTTRQKLELVTQARSFADAELGLAAGESYTTYSWVDSDTLLMVVSAARKDRFRAYTWWFPIVGRVPYKGYFDFEHAYREASELEQKGYDTDVRPSAAFSTLGWFNDPLLNTLLRYSDVPLAGTVIHEITHNSLYLPGQAGFNESFANFVGDRGAVAFFCLRDPQDARCKTAGAAWQDNIVFGAALTDLVTRLERLYENEGLSAADKIRQRAAVFDEWAERYRREVVPRLRTLSFRGYADQPLNNARLVATRLYYQRLDLFEQVFQKYNQDLRAATHAIIAAAESRPKDPFAAVEALLE
ncbi:MAG: aminopeptidase, partial [Gemmatimonadota bacterium]